MLLEKLLVPMCRRYLLKILPEYDLLQLLWGHIYDNIRNIKTLVSIQNDYYILQTYINGM